MNETLYLPLKAKWYKMIESGEKTEEYREIKPYWCDRILHYCPLSKAYWESVLGNYKKKGTPYERLILYYGTRGFDKVCLSYGYTKRRMTWEIESIRIGYGNPEWGAPKDKEVFIIKLKRRIK